MKWFYAQAAFIPIILSHFKDKMPINTQKNNRLVIAIIKILSILITMKIFSEVKSFYYIT